MRLKILLLLGCVAALPPSAYAQSAPMLFCGSIGAKVGPITRAVADSLGMPERYGAVFRRLRPGGPAASAGVEAFDVVTAINGIPLAKWRNFTPTISAMAPGTVVNLTTYRNRQSIGVSVTLGWSKCSNGRARRVGRGLRDSDVVASKPQGTRSTLD